MSELDAAGRVLVNRSELALAFGKSLPTIDAYHRRGMPYVQAGGQGKPWLYDLDVCKAWRRDDLALEAEEVAKKKAAIEETERELDLERQQSDAGEAIPLVHRERYYRSEAVRHQVDRERGFLCETAKVTAQMLEIFEAVRDFLQGLPDQLERKGNLTPGQVALMIDLVDQQQAELHRQMVRKDDDSDLAA